MYLRSIDWKATFKTYGLLTFATTLMVIGIYVFKFPNNFTFGGVTGLAVVLTAVLPVSASLLTSILNVSLLALGFAFIGRSFGVKTVFVTFLMTLELALLEAFVPLSAPLTTQPVLELAFATALPAVSAAILFNMDASSGGTDIVAMILKKYTSLDIGRALFLVDMLITVSSFLFYGVETGLFSLTGLVAKTFVIDGAIEDFNLCKYFNIICDNPEPICHFIVHVLKRSATVCEAQGAFTHGKKAIVFTALKRPQAMALRQFVRATEPNAFILISNTSEIIGKGFLNS